MSPVQPGQTRGNGNKLSFCCKAALLYTETAKELSFGCFRSAARSSFVGRIPGRLTGSACLGIIPSPSASSSGAISSHRSARRSIWSKRSRRAFAAARAAACLSSIMFQDGHAVVRGADEKSNGACTGPNLASNGGSSIGGHRGDGDELSDLRNLTLMAAARDVTARVGCGWASSLRSESERICLSTRCLG